MKTFLEATEDFLRMAKRPQTVRQIYDGIADDIGQHKGDAYFTLSGILTQQVKKSTSNIFVVNYSKPRTLWLKSRKSELENLGIKVQNEYENIINDNVIEKKEKDLYPILINSLRGNSIYGKRIDEKITEKGKKGINKWIHPDIVAAKYFFEEYSDDVNSLIENNSSSLFELYSFEVKTELNLLNLKEYYFQAVSNSSWANYGYLVCGDYDDDNEELENEITRLVNSFGIGILKLNTNDDNKIGYDIKFHARHKSDLDYATIENLCGKNEDFEKFINKVNKSIKIKTVQEF